MFIFRVTVVLYFINILKILSGSCNFCLLIAFVNIFKFLLRIGFKILPLTFRQNENDVPVFRCSGIPVFRHSGVPSFTTCRNWWSTMLLFFSFSWNSTKSRKQWRKLKMVENLKSCTSHERRCFHITFSFSFWLLEYLWFCNQWDHGTTCENNDCQECFWYVLCFFVMFFIQKHFCHVFEW